MVFFYILVQDYTLCFIGSLCCRSVIAGQTMVWAIFHLLPLNVKFQWVILSKFNIAISVVNGLFIF